METNKESFGGTEFSIFHYDENAMLQLNEARNYGKHLIGNYYYNVHQPHNPTGEYHLHLNDRGNEILSINKGGSAHDGYHGVKIPTRAYKELKDKFSDWAWPDDKIIESVDYTYMLNRDSALRPVLVFDHRNYNLSQVEKFYGLFHQFGADPFLTGGDGYKERTIAIIETFDGYIRKIPIDAFKFLDI